MYRALGFLKSSNSFADLGAQPQHLQEPAAKVKTRARLHASTL